MWQGWKRAASGPKWARISQILPGGSQRNAGVNELYHTGIILGQRLTCKKHGIPAWHLVPASCSLLPGSLHPPSSTTEALGGAQGDGVSL